MWLNGDRVARMKSSSHLVTLAFQVLFSEFSERKWSSPITAGIAWRPISIIGEIHSPHARDWQNTSFA